MSFDRSISTGIVGGYETRLIFEITSRAFDLFAGRLHTGMIMSSALTESEIGTALDALPGWAFADDKISKSFKLKDFSAALGFIVRIGIAAEKADHHPELFNIYNKVEISLNTHDAGSKVTQKDIDLALVIEGLV
ncbi:4a-hydroxytetrahydrobiopterin dehydratase [Rubellicoccus peritrichatus]|uniref:Putative pterin-4-alpha-carbinolamine dehydratase n=1 Tax=Rubellicoccus peritrichatus TaxID=3080537 RepID=A0AAQ3LCP1_9BACT|nr:4a-hydroxytetrahydrobiopterin dehydratase [Puniceicoccus sp. CR14]WOO43046.1 4a-hydroxytetrahydrobiopterin dehydratase [Puniceicoccus sp. CR14]